MIGFKQFVLLEGGNIQIELDGKTYNPDRLGLNKTTRKELQDLIYGILKDLNKKFKVKYNEFLWKDLDKLLEDEPLIISGSGASALSPEELVSWEELKDKKGSLGDIDIQYPEELKDKVKDFVKELQNKQVGGSKFLSYRTSGDQFNYIIEIPKDLGLSDNNVTYIQFDFEPVDFEHGERDAYGPQKISRYLHGSAWEDTQKGIKGVYNKYFAQAVLRTNVNYKAEDIIVFSYNDKTGKYKVTTNDKFYENPVGLFASSQAGTRAKLRPITLQEAEELEIKNNEWINAIKENKKDVYSLFLKTHKLPTGNYKPLDVINYETGKTEKGLSIDGYVAFWELDTKSNNKYNKSTFIKDFNYLAKLVTGKEDPENMMSAIKMMKSVAELPMFKNIENVRELYNNFIKGFVWSGKSFYKDPKLKERDIQEKDAITKLFLDTFKISDSKILEQYKKDKQEYINKGE